MARALTIALRFVAWLLAAAVTFVTLGPALYRPQSNLGQNGEHTLVFGLVGAAFALAYPRHRPIAAGLAIILLGVLELLQLAVPGRHARLEDFVVDALAALAGFAITGLAGWARRSHWHAKP